MSTKAERRSAVKAGIGYLLAEYAAAGVQLPDHLAKRVEAFKAGQKYVNDPYANVKMQAEQHLATAVEKYFDGLRDRIAAWAEKRRSAKMLPAEFWANENKHLAAVLGPQMQRMYYAGEHMASEKLSVAFDVSMANKAAADWAAQNVDALLKSFHTTTQAGVAPVIEEWITTDGATMGDLLQALLDTGLMGPDRASRVAVTETTRSFAQGEIAQYQELGIEQMRWQTNNDEVVCSTCEPLNGQVRKIGDTFDGDIFDPPAHVNCRCWLTPVTGEKTFNALTKGHANDKKENPAG
jgi:SPP1 gp7 family putative phage head morphogenesis protein